MRDRRDDEPTIVFEADEPAIKQMIDTRREQQPVLAIEPFFVRRVAPWLAVARHQMNGVFYTGNTAVSLDPAHALLEKPLPLSCLYDGEPFGVRDRYVVGHAPLEPPFPGVEVIGDDGPYLVPCR